MWIQYSSGMFRGLAQKYAVPGWILLSCYVVIEILDWWQRIDFLSNKIMHANPLLSSVFDFVVSSQGRSIILVSGLVLIFLAATRRRETAPSPSTSHDKVGRATAVDHVEPMTTGGSTNGTRSDRIFVDVTPDDLKNLFVNHTDIEGQRLAQPYMGKWMKISGAINNISSYGPDHTAVTFIKAGFSDLFMHFKGEQWKERLSTIRQGSSVTVIGKITRVSSVNMDLHECELV